MLSVCSSFFEVINMTNEKHKRIRSLIFSLFTLYTRRYTEYRNVERTVNNGVHTKENWSQLTILLISGPLLLTPRLRESGGIQILGQVSSCRYAQCHLNAWTHQGTAQGLRLHGVAPPAHEKSMYMAGVLFDQGPRLLNFRLCPGAT